MAFIVFFTNIPKESLSAADLRYENKKIQSTNAQKEQQMTDGISKISHSTIEVNNTADRVKDNKLSANSAADHADATKVAVGNDEVILSKTAETAMAAGDFDALKVEKIKLALAEGSYPLDPRRIAESFVGIESMLGGN